MRHGAAAAFLERQARLGAIERLDLALLVHREHQRLVRRIEVEANDVLHLLDEPLVVRQLECLHPVRLELVRLPDALDAGVAEPDGRRHLADAPVGSGRRLLVQRLVHHLLDRLGSQRRLAPRSRAVAPQARNAFGEVALLPAADRHLAHPDRPRDRHHANPVCRKQHDPRPPHHLLRRVPTGNPPFQRRPVRQATARCMLLSSSCRQIRTAWHARESSVRIRTLAHMARRPLDSRQGRLPDLHYSPDCPGQRAARA